VPTENDWSLVLASVEHLTVIVSVSARQKRQLSKPVPGN